MKQKLLMTIIILNLYSQLSFATIETAVWKGTYYQGIPNESNISPEYCQDHTPGTFVHSVKNMLDQGVETDKKIKLDQGTFQEKKNLGLYFVTGELRSRGKTGNAEWEDHIHYYFYKLTEYGVTQGVWSTGKCKGLYTGVLITDKNAGF